MRNRINLPQKPGIAGLILSLLLMLAFTPSWAQTITANIGGTVTDSTGAILPGATVTAINVDTGVKVSTTTNSTGAYSLRFLQIGSYKVSVTAKGFETSIYGPYTLEIDQIAQVDAKLKVGASTESVIVQADVAPILNTDNSQIDTTLDENTIKNIPLNGQNFSQLMLYLPGAVTTQPTGYNGVSSVERDTGSSGQISVNGNRLQTNNYLWNGVEINETINNLIGYSPSPEAIGEIKIVSANPNAEYGNANGGDVVMVMKSGTNQWHGSAFGFEEDQNFNAYSWSQKRSFPNVGPKDKFTQGQFGGSLGGPILHNRLFFFGDYAAGRIHQGTVEQLNVLTAKMRTGDFSELLNPSIMCLNGATSCSAETQLYDTQTPAAGTGFAPYTNNQNVPISNPVAQYLFAHPEYYPLPNHAPNPGTAVTGNFTGVAGTFNRYDQGDVGVDWTPTQRDRFTFTYSQAEGVDGTSNYPVPVFFQNGSDYPDKIFTISNIHTFSPSLVNEFRAGFSRIRWIQGDPVDPTGVFGLHGDQVVGIGNSTGTQPFQGFAAQQISGLNTPGNPAGGTNFIDNTFHYTEALTWQHGKHNSKAGVEFVRYQQNNFYPGNDGALGIFQYNGNFTSNPQDPLGHGYGGADFALDRVFFEGIGGVTGRTGQRQWRSAYYVQDDWRILPSLTLNLGLRYEFDQPIYEVNNKTANVNLKTGQVEYAGSIPASNTVPNATVCPNRACYNPVYTNFMPRIGFAYQVNPRWVVRSGYGITNFLEGTGANLRLTYNPPFQPSLELTGVAPTNNGTTTTPGSYFQASNGFTASATPNYSGTVYRAWDSNLRPAFVSTWSLSTQYEVNAKSSVTLAYVGESGQHLIQAVAANQLYQPCFIGGVLQTNPNSTACAAADPAPFQTLVGQSGAVVETASEAMYNYNALQATYRQLPMNGLEFTVNYTYGRSMTNSDGFFGVPNINGPSPYAQNAYDNHAEYGPTGQDIRNNLNGTAVYELPFGRGHLYGANMNRALDEAVGGWKLSMGAVAYSGFPATPYNNNNVAFTNNRANRPNQYMRLHIVNRSINNWFGTDPSSPVGGVCTNGATGYTNGSGQTISCAFGDPANGTYGTAKPNALRAPGYQQYDFSLFKDFRIVGDHNLNFRVDAFNAFNIASYGNPDTNIDDGSTFGYINSVRSPIKQFQFAAKYSF